MGARRDKIDWSSIPIVIEEESEPNPDNPYAMVSQMQRDQTLREIARSVLLRRAGRLRQST